MQAPRSSDNDAAARRRITLFKSKTPTILTATAVALGALGAAPLAHAAVPAKHPDRVGVAQKHPDRVGVAQKHPDIIGVLGSRPGSAPARKAGGDPRYLVVRKAGGLKVHTGA